MLGFLRRHQRVFFIFITVIIVISFSFFGTYNAIMETNSPTAEFGFAAADGSRVSKREEQLLVQFLRTDRKDKVNYGGAWGPNFLNDGVIERDLLETGIAKLLIQENKEALQSDFESRHKKEQRYHTYQHPSAQFISVENAWNAMLPEMSRSFKKLQEVDDPLSSEGINARISLYLLERQFPPHTMKQLLSYQERQYGWVQPDPQLGQADLFLFNYHHGEDWFGTKFYQMAARFIIQCAKVAEMQGYSVSDNEALASLLQNANASFEENKRSPYLGSGSPQAYFREQLRRMGIDQKTAVKTWKNVLLMRRLFQEASNAVYIDPMISREFSQFAHASIDGDLYQFPEAFRISDFRSLVNMEFYLSLLSGEKSDTLKMPEELQSTGEIAKAAPELVQKKYRIKMKHVDLDTVGANIAIRELWKWQTEPKNWTLLQENFPMLGMVEGKTENERFKAIESLDPVIKSKVNDFSREKMIAENPGWINDRFENAEFETVELRLGKLGSDPSLQGVESGEALIQILDNAPLEKEVAYDAEEGNSYRFIVLEKSSVPEVLSYADALNQGVMKKIADKKLQSYYEKIRDDRPDSFRLKEGGWKPLNEVREAVAADYFSTLLKKLKEDYLLHNPAEDKSITNDRLASYRLAPFAREAMAALKEGGEGKQWIESDEDSDGLTSQWKLRKNTLSFERRDQNKIATLFENPNQEWVDLKIPPNGDISFFHVIKRGSGDTLVALNQTVSKIKDRLAPEVKKDLAQQVLEKYPVDFGVDDAE